MNYRYLEAFIFSVKEMSFSKAARKLNITPAALGRQVRLLEQSINRQLIIRSPQSFILTPAGRALYDQVNQFDTWARSEYSNTSHQTIRIMALQGIIENWLIDKIIDYKKFTDLSFEIIRGEPSDTDKFLTENKVDITITNKYFQNEILSSRKLFKESIVLVSNNKITPKDINKFTWVTTNPRDYIINYSLQKKIQRPSSIIYVESIRASIKLIESGRGIAMMPEHLVQNNKKLFLTKINDFDEESIYRGFKILCV